MAYNNNQQQGDGGYPAQQQSHPASYSGYNSAGPVQRPGDTPNYQSSPSYGQNQQPGQPQYNSSPSYGQSQQPGQPQYTNTAYGQNQGYQSQDQQQYTSQQSQQSGYASNNSYPPPPPPQQQQQYPQGGAVVVTTQVTSAVPNQLIHVNDRLEVYYLERYNTLNIIILCVAAFVFGSCIITFAVGAGTWVTGLFLAAAIINGGFFLWFTKEARLEFEHDTKTVRITEKRMYQHFCQPSTIQQSNYRQLGSVGFSGGPGMQGDLYLDLADHRVLLARRVYQTDMQIAAEVEPWRLYVDKLRAMDGGGGGGLVGAVVNVVTSTVARL